MRKNEHYNVPNALSVFRLVGVPLLFWLVTFPEPWWFLGWFIILGLTDSLDGALARKWNQTSEFGAFLDTIADLAYYFSAAWFLYFLFPDYITPNLGYLTVLLVMFGIVLIYTLVRFRKVHMLHTHISRFSGVLVFIAMIASFFMDTTLVVRTVILLYTFAFIEFMLIFILYGEVSANTRSIFVAAREKRILEMDGSMGDGKDVIKPDAF